MSICIVCGDLLSGKQWKYCSRGCKEQAAYNRKHGLHIRHMPVCVLCREPLDRNKKYCDRCKPYAYSAISKNRTGTKFFSPVSKRCPECGKIKLMPAFGKKPRKNKNGNTYMHTRPYCKPCRAKREHRRRIERDECRTSDGFRSFVCKECKRTFKSNYSGYCSDECRSNQSIKFAPPMERSEYNYKTEEKVCPVCDKEFVGKLMRVYCSDECLDIVGNERHRLYQAEKRANNPELRKKDLNRLNYWKDNNPEKVAFAKKRRRHAIRSLPATLTEEEWSDALESFGNRCVYCGADGELHQDHFVPVAEDGPYTKENIVPACRSCNSKKGALMPEEFCDEDTYKNVCTTLLRN